MSEQQTDGEVRVILHLAPAWIHAETLLASPLHVVSPNLDSAVCAVLHTLPAETLCLLYPPKGDPKYARKKNPSSSRPSFFPLYIPLSHLSSLSFSLSLRLKGLCFQRKRLHSMGEKRKKKSSSFFVFFFQTAAVSHIASPIHTLTPQEPSPCPNPPQNTTWDNPTPHLPPRLSSLHTPPAHPGV